MNILPKPLLVLITDVSFEDDLLQVLLSDGREIRVPLEWFPRLRNGSPEHRQNWRLIGKEVGIHWPELDEDISLDGLVR
jgi:hypothetical protein